MEGLLLRPHQPPSKPAAKDNDPDFEIVTIRPNLSGRSDRRIQMDRQLRATNTSLKDLMKFFFDVHERQIEGGPDWMNTARFDIVAQPATEAEISPARMNALIRKLIVGRFSLAFHREERRMPVYAVTVDESGPRMIKGDPNGPGDPDFNGLGNMKAKAMSMDELAGVFQGVVMDGPVLNRTGLEGKYVFTLIWAPDASQFSEIRQRPSAQAFADRDDLFTALRKQLGLKLEATEAPVEVLIIDHAGKPSEN